MTHLSNLLSIGIFSLILHVIGASDPEPTDQTKISRQEKQLEIDFPFKEADAGQSAKFNLNNYENFVKFGGKTSTQGIPKKYLPAGATKPVRNVKKTGKYAAKMKNLKAQGVKPQKNLRVGFFETLFWGANAFSGQASVSSTQNNYNNYCNVMCSSKFSYFSDGECFNTSPYYANKPCDCLCAYAATDYANTEYELCIPENPDLCNRFCQALDSEYWAYNAAYDKYLLYKNGRCSNGQCYCCGSYRDLNMIDFEVVEV